MFHSQIFANFQLCHFAIKEGNAKGIYLPWKLKHVNKSLNSVALHTKFCPDKKFEKHDSLNNLMYA